MTRDTIKEEILSLKGRNFIFELATGTGKSWLALEKIRQLSNNIKGRFPDLLIVVPRNVLKDNWSKEIDKWYPDHCLNIQYTTYASLEKYASQYWDFIIFDECHHLSARCLDIVNVMKFHYTILCSATIPRSKKDEIKNVLKTFTLYKQDLRDVINADILPDPTVYLIPLHLDTTIKDQVYTYSKGPNIVCTEATYYNLLSSLIQSYKNAYMRTYRISTKNRWLYLCNERLKWLSDRKVRYTEVLLNALESYRTITFCNTIEQTEKLGKYCINSKNKESSLFLKSFNEGKINHITACNILNEGVNISDCQVGVFNNLNASEIIVNQRCGRILRHKEPLVIIPYFVGTREEELVNKLTQNFNPSLIKYYNGF